METSAFLTALLLLLATVTSGHAGSRELQFVREPVSALVQPGQLREVFRCVASPNGAKISWLRDDQPLEMPSPGLQVQGNRLILHLAVVPDPWTHSYRCVARHQGSAIVSLPARLIQAKLDEFPQQDNLILELTTGNTAVIPCTPPSSIPFILTEFFFNGHKIAKSSDRHLLLPTGNLHILNAQPEDSGEYRCVAHNPYLAIRREDSRLVKLSVLDTNAPFTASKFVAIPQEITQVVTKSNITLECAATGNPSPEIYWERLDRKPFPSGRFFYHGGNLELHHVSMEDQGIYVCKASNTLQPEIAISTYLEIQEPAAIVVHPPVSQEVHPESNVSLVCGVSGQPRPDVTWFHNGLLLGRDSSLRHRASRLDLVHVSPKQAGVYQCFVANELGGNYAVSRLAVPVPGDPPIDAQDSEEEMTDDYYDVQFPRRRKKKNKKKGVKMAVPSRPEVSQLSETSVMVSWSLPSEDGLPISFFKVQFKDESHKEDWVTVDEDIAANTFNHVVHNLGKQGGSYRFRIAAVYSNNDNKLSPMSRRLILGPVMDLNKLTEPPVLVDLEPLSPNSVKIIWEYSGEVEGFVIHWRPVASAGVYNEQVALGTNLRAHPLTGLNPDTAYEVKLQAFNGRGPSPFSNIKAARTTANEEEENNEVLIPGASSQGIRPPQLEIPPSESTVGLVVGCSVGLALMCLVCLLCLRSHRHRTSHGSQPSKEAEAGTIETGEKVNITLNPFTELPAAIRGQRWSSNTAALPAVEQASQEDGEP